MKTFLDMKKLFYVFMIAAMSQLLACTNANESASVDASKVKFVELKVEGMTCEGCEKTLERSLSAEQGVLSVSASADSALVRIKVNPNKYDMKSLLQTIENKGYEAEPYSNH